ncbi:MAG: mechanosensitive ion channel domain-containing protein [Pseudomonadota bacterium]
MYGPKKILLSARRIGAVVMLFGALHGPALAQEQPPAPSGAESVEAQALAARRAAVEQEQAAVARERAELEKLRKETLRQLKALDIGQIERVMVEQAELKADAERVNLGGVEVDLQSAEQQAAELNAAIQDIQQRLGELKDTEAAAKLQQELALKQAALELENQHVANLRAARYIAGQRLELALRWAQELKSQYKTARELSDKTLLSDLQARIQKEQQDLMDRAADLRKRLEALQGDDAATQAERSVLRARLLETEELARMKPTELALAQAQVRLNALDAMLAGADADTEELAAALNQADDLLRELEARREFVQRKTVLWKQQQALVAKRLDVAAPERAQTVQDSRALEKILDTLDKQAKQVAFLIESARDKRRSLDMRYDQALRSGLLVRQTLPGDSASWQRLGLELLALPTVLWQTISGPLLAAARAGGAADWGLVVLSEALWLGLLAWTARRCARTPPVESGAPGFSAVARRLAARLLHANVISIAVIGALLIPFLLAGAPQPGFTIFLIFAGAWLAYKTAIDLAHLLLLDPKFAQRGTHPRLYRVLRWWVPALSALTALVLLVHLTELSPLLRDFVDRSFMLLLAPALLLVLRGRRLLLAPLAPVLSPRWLHLAERVVVILTLAMLVSAVVGMLGYINLAWNIALHVGLFLLMTALWLLLRGLLRDVFQALRRYTSSPRYALPCPQSLLENLLEPVQRGAQIVLFVLAWWTLFQLYGWDADTPVVRDARAVLFSPLFTIDNKPIHLFGILLTLAIIMAVVWLGRWSRELTYRWLFYKVANSGARHSLSVFTQYLVVLVGFLIALRVLGIDLTTLTVFAGALGVGIGFGLQNVANNFVSGILLLIERPVRTGDVVTIGANEGAVTRIGIRSLTIKTPDSQEVIIPNSEVISHPFMNWTYTDTLVRTSLIIGITYQNDLHLARKIIEQALQNHPAVIKSAQNEVLLDEFGGATVNFRVHYFTDLCGNNRQEIKSQLLFQIWDSFKRAGVRFPGPPPPPDIAPLPAPVK